MSHLKQLQPRIHSVISPIDQRSEASAIGTDRAEAISCIMRNRSVTLTGWPPCLIVGIILGWLFLIAPLAFGQADITATTVTALSLNGGDQVTVAEVTERIEALDANTGIEDSEKEALMAKYRQAMEILREVEVHKIKVAVYRDAVKTGPVKTAEWQARLEGLPPVEEAGKIRVEGGEKDLQEKADRQWAILEVKKEEFKAATTELARIKGRPLEISSILPDAHRRLSEFQARLAAPEFSDEVSSATELADKLLLEVRELKVLGELEVLKQEQLSQLARETELRAKIDLLGQEVTNSEAMAATIRAGLRQRLHKEVEEVTERAETLNAEVGTNDKFGVGLVSEARMLAKEFEQVIGSINETVEKREAVRGRMEALVNSYDLLKDQLKIRGGGVAMAQVLFSLERKLPSLHALKVEFEKHEEELDSAYLSLLQIDRKLGEQDSLEKRHGANSSMVIILEARREVLGKLGSQYGRLIRRKAELVGAERRYLDEIEEVRGFLSKELFWMRSSPPLGLSALAATPGGLRWICRPEHWYELGNAIALGFHRQLVVSCLIFLSALIILRQRRRIYGKIKETGLLTRRIATDHYLLTVRALVLTVLVALPIPLLMGYLAWATGQCPEPSSWLQGLAFGFRKLTWIGLALGMFAAICHKDGIGTGHFRLPEKPLTQFRRSILWFVLLYAPLFLLLSSCLFGEASDYFGSAGRVCFILGLLWGVFVYWRFLRDSDEVEPGKEGAASVLDLTSWRRTNFGLAAVAPLALVVLSWIGFQYTALELSLILFATVGVAAAGELIYWLILRWLTIRVRRLTFARALARRRERQEAAQGKEEERDEAGFGEAEAEWMDVAAIGEQTRRLILWICVAGMLIAISLLWSEIFPVFAILDSVTLIGKLTPLALGKAVLIAVVTTVAVKNLPGLIKLISMHTSHMASGNRNALISLCQYVLIAIGFAWVFEVLDLSWIQFGWIATALSVGLGFGLQEVVANFVCGVILLFEQPIRVGDYVTVEGMFGKVTKIRMRATTIVNWDSQEFVVPNKNFVTGTLLNWTLKNSITRIVLSVGVAYGSDTDKAQRILLEIATANPMVLDEPEPAATFEEFADSSLTLRLKTHIATVEKRIDVLSELHSAVKKRFEEEGIEIAFPQRDLHLKTPGFRVVADQGDEVPEARQPD